MSLFEDNQTYWLRHMDIRHFVQLNHVRQHQPRAASVQCYMYMQSEKIQSSFLRQLKKVQEH